MVDWLAPIALFAFLALVIAMVGVGIAEYIKNNL